MSIKDILKSGQAPSQPVSKDKKGGINQMLAQTQQATLADELKNTNNKLSEVTANRDELKQQVQDLQSRLSNKEVSLTDYEEELQKLNVSVQKPIDPQTLTPHPIFQNRTPGYFEVSKQQADFFKSHIVDGNEPEDNVYIDKFLALIITLYKDGKNNSAIAYTKVKHEGKELLCPIFGESRWQAIKWLYENGYTHNGKKEIQLIGFISEQDDDLSFKQARLTENSGRIDLHPIELAIQINDLYNEYYSQFESGTVPKTRNQRASGYALQQLSFATKKGVPSLKKYKQIGKELGTNFSTKLGIFANYVNYTNLCTLATKLDQLSIEYLANTLYDLLSNKVKSDNFDIHSITISSEDKSTYVNNIIKEFCVKHKPKPSSDNNNENTIAQSNKTKSTNSATPPSGTNGDKLIDIESLNGIKISISYNESNIASKKLLSLLNDANTLEETLNDYLRSHI